MPTPAPELLAQAILAKEKRKADAKAVLNRTASRGPLLIVTVLLIGLASFLVNVPGFDAPLWTKVVLVVGFIVSVQNAVELWTTRRRLEAAITLLQLEQE